MIRSHLSNYNYPARKISYLKCTQDIGVQTDECLSLKIGDQILLQFNQPEPSCKGIAESTTWWHNLFKWN